MDYPYVSIYPKGIDKRTYFCDVDIDRQAIMDVYNELLSENKFTEANTFIKQQNIHHYSSGLLNFIIAKIYNTQEHVLSLEKYNPFHCTNNEPNIKNDEFWI